MNRRPVLLVALSIIALSSLCSLELGILSGVLLAAALGFCLTTFWATEKWWHASVALDAALDDNNRLLRENQRLRDELDARERTPVLFPPEPKEPRWLN